MSNMIRLSLDPEGQHNSPLSREDVINETGQGGNYVPFDSILTDESYEGIQVKMLWYPKDKEAFDRMVYKAVVATRGSDINADEFDPVVVEEAFAGGLNQCLEWVTVVFEISGVTRGLTHELVRTRKASFSQQSMRHTNMGYPAMRMPQHIAEHPDPEVRRDWWRSIGAAADTYWSLVHQDIPYQDARTVLPIATETYIIASYPLSVFLATYAYRACYMFYPEIVYLFRKMREALLEVCPWLDPFIKVSCEKTRPNGEQEHMCTYQGWERVEGHCPLAWAKEDNRVWKSSKFEN